jgi:DNA processing protein
MPHEDLKFKIGVTLIPGIGAINAKKLVAYCGGAEAVFKESAAALEKIPGLGKKIIKQITTSQEALTAAEEEIQFMVANDVKALFYLDKEYPRRLKHCEDGPLVLFTKGNIDFNREKVISIIGTRNATVSGRGFTEKLIEQLVPHQPLIVSGLAFGIDITAHKAALQNNLQTVGILAHGLDTIYPTPHTNTAKKMLENGGIASDYRHGRKIFNKQFAERNRIVAGLSDVTIVVESAAKGGSLITAELANGYNRDVFAVPGRVNDEFSIGCNRLIKSNKAALIESVKDIEYVMRWSAEKETPKQTSLFDEVSEEERVILELLSEGPESVDIISIRAKLPMSKTTTVLLGLEFKGALKSLPGKMYQLL